MPVCVQYKVFLTPTLDGSVIAQGEAFTSYDVDWTVKVEATGLKADTKYWYQFSDCTDSSAKSPIGATRTIASPNSMYFLTMYIAGLNLFVFASQLPPRTSTTEIL